MQDVAVSVDEYHRIFRYFDWGATPLGAKQAWSAPLRRAVDLLLDIPQPAFLGWGEDHLLLFNAAFAGWLGEGQANALGRSGRAFWREEWTAIAPFFAQALAGHGAVGESLRLPGAEEARDLSIAFTPIRDDSGGVAGVLGTCADTRARARALRMDDEERRMRLLEDLPGFFAKFTVPDYRVAAANRAYRKLVGDRPLVGLAVDDALPEFGAKAVELFESVTASGAPFFARAQPVRFTGPGGETERVLDLVCAPLEGADGGVEAVVVAGHDVTEHVHALEQVEELQNELIHLSRVSAMGTMASTLGHELNQPLTAIVNYATVARRMIPEQLSPQADEALQAIADNALRAGRLIRSLRTMSRKGGTDPTRFSVAEAVAEAIKLSALACACPVEMRVPASLKAWGDRVQIEQVLMNLIRNACEAAAGNGEAQVEVTGRRSGGKALITVSDNGPGIQVEPIDKVFAPFVSTKADGIGIGLPISRTIADSHGGKLWAENRKEGGASFHLELPCNPPGAAPAD